MSDIVTILQHVKQLYLAGRFAEGMALAEQIRGPIADQLEDQHPLVAVFLDQLGVLYQATGNYHQAESHYMRALTIWECAYGETDPNTARCLGNLATLYRERGDLPKAEQLTRSAARIVRKAVGEHAPEYLMLISNLSQIYEAQARYGRALALQERIEKGLLASLGESDPRYASAINNRGSLLRTIGRFVEAEEFMVKACALTERFLGRQYPEYSKSVSNLAGMYHQLGFDGKALPLFSEALTLAQKIYGPEHNVVASRTNNLAECLVALGKYAEAERLHVQTFNMFCRTLGETHSATGISLNNLGCLYRTLHDFAKAESSFLRAIEVQRQALGERHPNVARTLNNLAGLYEWFGQPGQALPLYEEATTIRRRALGANHPAYAQSLNNIGGVWIDLHEYKKGETCYREAVEIWRGAYGTRNAEYGKGVGNLGYLRIVTGDFEDGRRLLREALDSVTAGVGDDHVERVPHLLRLAHAEAVCGEKDDALQDIAIALRIEGRFVIEAIGFSSETRRLSLTVHSRQWLDFALSLVFLHFRDSPEAIRSACDYVLRRKALTAEAAGVQQRAILEGRYPHLRHRLEQLNLLRGQIALKIKAGPGPKEAPKAHQKTLAVWRAEREALEAELARAIPEMRLERSLAGVDARAVAARITGNGALVEFARFNLFDFQAVQAKGETPWTGARYVAFVLPAGESESVRLVDLGEAAPIDAAIQEFRQKLTGGLGDPKGIATTEDAAPPASAEPAVADRPLRALTFDPLVAALGGCRTLILSPDGELTRLPFEALTMPDGRYLIDHYEIRYVTSGRDLVRIAEAEVLAGTDPLVLADPAFNLGSRPAHAAAPKGGVMDALLGWLGRRTRVADGERASGRSGEVPPATEGAWLGRCSRDLERGEIRFDPLPGSREEGQRLGRRLGASPLIAEAALEGRLKKQRSPAIVHLATHGFFLENQPWKARDLGFSGEMGVMDRLAGQENPMLRSGLALAGANTFLRERRSVSDEMEDGLLTAEDVAGMDLLNTELVFLSACETGLGDVQVGEGVFGLRRAFVIAGARTLIMTLWKVSDLATAILVDHFYERLLDGTPKGKALRQAQHDLRTGELGELRPRWLSEPMRESLAAGDAKRRRKLDELAAMPDDFRPFTHPYYWAAFILQGDDGVLRWQPRVTSRSLLDESTRAIRG